MFLTLIVNLTGISADFLRYFAIVVIGLFGLVLVLPRLQAAFEIFASKVASKGQALQSGKSQIGAETGFWGGTAIGVSLGLVWTPCVGPILASVISLALTESANFQAVLITLAYSIGTAIPMLVILYGGRALVSKFSFLTRNLGKIQKVFGVLMILTALALFFNLDRKFQTYVLDKFPGYGSGLTSIEDNEIVQQELEKLYQDDSKKEPLESGELQKAPELIYGGEWFNSEPLKIGELKGKVVLVDFWTYSCINCQRTFPYLRDWHEKYSDQGLVIIGAHTPEFEFEKNPSNLQKAIDDFDLQYPIFQDNNYETWRAYENHWWPSKYLIDHEGNLVYNHHGEGRYEETEKLIQELLAEAGYNPDSNFVDYSYETYSQTPETYLGYRRIKGFASTPDINEEVLTNYESPETLAENRIAFSGDWTINDYYSVPGGEGSAIEINFESMKVFLVMNPAEGEVGKVRVLLDGEVVVEEVVVDEDKLYDLIDLEEPGRHLLRLEFLDDNTEVYAFTFG